MKIEMQVTKEVDVCYLKVDANVRYWEDGKINGERDINLEDSDDPNAAPKMPCAVKVGDEWHWMPVIDLNTGNIIGWPKGTSAYIYYKVCDEGVYTLLDADQKEIRKVESYVPDCLSIDECGYGDYIIMTVNKDGHIEDFEFGQDEYEDLIEHDFNND